MKDTASSILCLIVFSIIAFRYPFIIAKIIKEKGDLWRSMLSSAIFTVILCIATIVHILISFFSTK